MIYYAIYPAADPIPPAQDIIDGVVPDSISYSVASPVETSLGFTTELIGGLTSGTEYKISAVDDSGSNVATSAPFTTLEVTSVIPMKPAQVVYRPNKVTVVMPGFVGVARVYWVIYPASQDIPTGPEIVTGTVPNGIFSSDLAPTSDTDDFVGTVFSALNMGTVWRLAAVASNTTEFSNVVVTDELNVAFVEKVLIPSTIEYQAATVGVEMTNPIELLPADIVYELEKLNLPSAQSITLKPARIGYQTVQATIYAQIWVPIVPEESIWQKVG